MSSARRETVRDSSRAVGDAASKAGTKDRGSTEETWWRVEGGIREGLQEVVTSLREEGTGRVFQTTGAGACV